VIRITATEILANAILTPAIAQFRRRYPEVQVELVSSDFPLDVDGGEVDVAMRSGRQLPASDLLARKVADWDFALFCSRDYAERRGAPRSLAELKDHDLISVETPLGPGPGVAWMLQQAGGKAAAHTSNTMINLVSAVQAGLGIAPMPSLLMDPDPRMVRCSDDIASERVSSWIVTRRGRRDAARIAAFVDFLVPFVQQDVKARVARSRAVREGLTAGEAI
jgi:DNA-binding transcriptional LysR family regulator